MPAEDISKMDVNTVRKNQDEAAAYDAKVKAEIQEKLNEERRKAENEAAKPVYTPRCPTCGSPNIHKVSTTAKLVDAAVWGLLARKPRVQFHCDDCGYEW